MENLRCVGKHDFVLQDLIALNLIPIFKANLPVCPTKQREPKILKSAVS